MKKKGIIIYQNVKESDLFWEYFEDMGDRLGGYHCRTLRLAWEL